MATKTLSGTVFLDYARLRAAVGLLGEEAEAGWWQGNVLGRVGQAVIARLFPTAPVATALRAATAAAARAHDERIGQSGVYHPFRLPTSMEAEIAVVLSDQVSVLLPIVRDAVSAREELLALAGSTLGKATAGPRAVGDVQDAGTDSMVATLAGLYAAALDAGQSVHPYFTVRTGA